MTTKEKILKEFEEKFGDDLVRWSGAFENTTGEKLWEPINDDIKSFLSSALDTYGKERESEARGDEGMSCFEHCAQARAQAFDEAIAKIEKKIEDVCSFCHHQFSCKDHHEVNGIIFCPHDHHKKFGFLCPNPGTAPCINIVCSEKEIGRNEMAQEILSTLNALRKK